jgi:hypothetical protein
MRVLLIMLRILFALLLLAPVVQIHAQTWPQVVMPSPWGVVISAGTWLWNLREPQYQVVVAGYGDTPQQQRTAAFRTAVETALDSLIISTTRTDQGQLTQDRITSHTAGVVVRWELVEQTPQRQVIRAWVTTSKINQANARASSAEAIVAPATSQLTQLAQGDAVIDHVLASYPNNSFTVKILSTTWQLTPQRRHQIAVKFTVTWRDSWQQAWRTAIHRTGNDKGWDTLRQNMALQRLIDTRPQVMLQLLDAGGTPIWQACKSYSELDHQVVEQHGQRFVSYEPRQVRLHDTQLRGHLAATVLEPVFANTASVAVSIVGLEQCP